MDMYDIGALPIGFSLKLSQDLEAMERFASMTKQEKQQVIAYVQGGTTGDEAEERVNHAVYALHKGKWK